MPTRCRKCPNLTVGGGLCRDCSLEERYGHGIDQDSQVDREVRLECIECGETYLGTSSTACPECGESRCRAAESEVATDGGRDEIRETHLGTRGLWIPRDLREFTGQVVFRTPRATIQHFQSGGGRLDPYYGAIDESHFGALSMLRDPRNPQLAPNHVSIKPQGEEAVELSVEIEPEVRCDGGQPVDGDVTSRDGMEHEAVTEIVSNGGRDSDGSPRMLSRWTFQYTPARKFVEKRLEGHVLNACAGRTKLNHDGEIIRNDLNPDRDADTHHDVVEIAEHFEPRSFDTVIFDPPFDEKQAETKYDGLHAMDVYAALEGFEEIVRPGGLVICFGWNSWGMRSFGAFERQETTLFQRGPIHRDVIATVDRRTSYSLASDGGNQRYVQPEAEHEEGSR